MREGEHTYYIIQHRTPDHEMEQYQHWATSDVGVFLFDGLTFQERKKGAEPGETYRKLMDPTHACWQETSEYGFLFKADAERCLDAIVKRKRNEKYEFRIAIRNDKRSTEEIKVVKPAQPRAYEIPALILVKADDYDDAEQQAADLADNFAACDEFLDQGLRGVTVVSQPHPDLLDQLGISQDGQEVTA